MTKTPANSSPEQEKEPSPPEELFPLEKILSSSAEAYIGSRGYKKLSDYFQVGVHALPVTDPSEDLRIYFQKAVPPGTEVVVDYIPCFHNNQNLSSGTALILKEQPKTKK